MRRCSAEGAGQDIHLPDLQFPALPRDEQALRYAFEAKRAAMGPYIVQRWGWDEALQFQLHGERFAEKPFFKIVWHGQDVGTVSLMRLADHIRFGEFYLFPEHQRRGIGSTTLSIAWPLRTRMPSRSGSSTSSGIRSGRSIDAIASRSAAKPRSIG